MIWEGFTTFFEGFKQKHNDFAASYSNMKLSQNAKDFLANKEEAFKQLESKKAGELFTPYLEIVEQYTTNFEDFCLLSLLGDERLEDEGVLEHFASKLINRIGVSTDASENEIENAMTNWMSNAFGISPNASDEEGYEALENWFKNSFGFSPDTTPEEEFNTAMENSFPKEFTAFSESFRNSSEEVKEMIPENLKERWENCKNNLVDAYEMMGWSWEDED